MNFIMMEEKKENKPEEKTEEKEVKPEHPPMVASAYEAAEALKVQNARMEENIKKLQELKAFETLGGKSEVGEPSKKQDAKEFFKGTDIERAIEKYG